MKDKFTDFMRNLSNHPKQSKKIIYIVIIGAIALFLLLMGNSIREKENDPYEHLPQQAEYEVEETLKKDPSEEEIVYQLEAHYERTLKEMLSKVQGVSNVEVMVNLDSTDIKVYEKNSMKGQQITKEADVNGGTREVEDHTEESELVLIREGDQEKPLLIQTKKPIVRGVLIIANGVEQASMKMDIIESVSKVLDVPTHKISVMSKN